MSLSSIFQYVCIVFKLSQAEDAVNSEIQRLEMATQHCLDGLESTFNEIMTSVERRKNELSTAIAQARDVKKKVLEEQLSLIQAEKDKVMLCEHVAVFIFVYS